jgi:L-lactate dehydrogenase complex protein LldF
MNAPRPFPEAARSALNDAALQTALGNLKRGFQVKRAHALEALSDPETLREAASAIRANALADLPALLERFEANVIKSGGHVHWARDAAEARRIIGNILKECGAKTVTKGKSMVAEEIELNAYLENEGITPVETDLGEYIIQLRKEPPSHIVAPAFHLRKEDVETSFRAAHTELDPARNLEAREALVAEARAILRQKFETAEAGITGANFLAADTGTAVVVTNEGNGDLTRLLPPVHIVITGIEKVVPSLEEVALLLRILPRAATGQEITSYVTFSTGPKRAADTGAPGAFHVVLLDNGRSDILGGPAHDVLKCIRCGACLNHCPVYGAVGGHAYGFVYPGPIGAALDPALDGLKAARDLPHATSACGRCDEVCPVKVPLTRIMRHWRNETFAQGLVSPGLKRGLTLWARAARSPRLYALGQRGFSIGARWIALGRARLSNLPFMGGWFASRDLAAPAKRSFQSQWRSGKR